LHAGKAPTGAFPTFTHLDGIAQDADQLARTLKYNDGRHDDLKHEPADTRLL
jgi:hypothetical protein